MFGAQINLYVHTKNIFFLLCIQHCKMLILNFKIYFRQKELIRCLSQLAGTDSVKVSETDRMLLKQIRVQTGATHLFTGLPGQNILYYIFIMTSTRFITFERSCFKCLIMSHFKHKISETFEQDILLQIYKIHNTNNFTSV